MSVIFCEIAIGIWSLTFVFFVVGVTTASADEVFDQETAACNRNFPALVNDFWARRQCFNDATRNLNLRRSASAALARENAARLCIAGDIPRLEEVLTKLNAAITPGADFSAAQEILQEIFSGVSPVVVTVPADAISEKVLAVELPTKCDSGFKFAIQIRTASDGNVRFLSVKAEDAPSRLWQSWGRRKCGAVFQRLRRRRA